MFETMTYEKIMQQLLDNVPTDVSKEEGSLVFSALSPLAYELEKAYINLDVTLNQTFADTADYDYLELRAAERGLSPIPATKCQARGEFNVAIPEGSRFFIGNLNYVVGEELTASEGFAYVMTCETPGTLANGILGTLTIVDTTDSSFDPSTIERAELTEILVAGADKETQESFLERYLNSFKAASFGGNVSDYLNKVTAIEGIGAAHIYPVWNGGGTVKVVVLGSDLLPASDYLASHVKEVLDPTDGEGDGLAPIGHTVTVSKATGVEVSVATTVTYQSGYSKEDVEAQVLAAVENYFKELRSHWQSDYMADKSTITVRIAEVESRILAVKGIVDIENTTLNNTSTNVILVSEEVPILKEVIF